MMEDVVLEKELEYYSKSTGEKVKALVKVYPSRLVIEKKNELESILIPYINVLKYYRDSKWGYLAAGIVLFFLAVIFWFLPVIKNTLIFETPLKEIISVFALFIGIICIIAWWTYRSFVLLINSFGYYANLISRKETPLREVYETLENYRTPELVKVKV